MTRLPLVPAPPQALPRPVPVLPSITNPNTQNTKSLATYDFGNSGRATSVDATTSSPPLPSSTNTRDSSIQLVPVPNSPAPNCPSSSNLPAEVHDLPPCHIVTRSQNQIYK